MKYRHLLKFAVYCNVAPYAGAWIEIINEDNIMGIDMVAPYAGAWIEI